MFTVEVKALLISVKYTLDFDCDCVQFDERKIRMTVNAIHWFSIILCQRQSLEVIQALHTLLL